MYSSIVLEIRMVRAVKESSTRKKKVLLMPQACNRSSYFVLRYQDRLVVVSCYIVGT